MSYKKAGIIVGGIILVIAIVFFALASGSDKKEPLADVETTKSTSSNEEIVNETIPEQGHVSNEPRETSQQSVHQGDGSYSEVDESSIASLKREDNSEVTYVSRKSIRLMDGQLYYVLDMILSDNTTLSYYVSESGYYATDVGEKVSINYVVYTNANGLKFYQITKVTTIE